MQGFRPLLGLLLLVTALISWWLAEETREKPAPITQAQGTREIDYYVSDLDVTRMTPAGIPAHRLRTPHLQHYIDDDTTELKQPHLTVYQAANPPWEIDSERASVSADGKLLLLLGDVLIQREGSDSNVPIHMTTRDLRVQPDQDYAETDEKVRVESGADWIDAVGMQAWLRPPSRLKFLSQVKGSYVPVSR
ncbi:MAG: LPS export ABC transporter periplasmic protein LptC [Chromatiaceae bacterium]|jgi:lipopolysaccharide export system protein LptC|nr:LPS export ABC transporter periplasmic protein LptC [Chromatiaceae bacterium]